MMNEQELASLKRTINYFESGSEALASFSKAEIKLVCDILKEIYIKIEKNEITTK